MIKWKKMVVWMLIFLISLIGVIGFDDQIIVSFGGDEEGYVYPGDTQIGLFDSNYTSISVIVIGIGNVIVLTPECNDDTLLYGFFNITWNVSNPANSSINFSVLATNQFNGTIYTLNLTQSTLVNNNYYLNTSVLPYGFYLINVSAKTSTNESGGNSCLFQVDNTKNNWIRRESMIALVLIIGLSMFFLISFGRTLMDKIFGENTISGRWVYMLLGGIGLVLTLLLGGLGIQIASTLGVSELSNNMNTFFYVISGTFTTFLVFFILFWFIRFLIKWFRKMGFMKKLEGDDEL